MAGMIEPPDRDGFRASCARDAPRRVPGQRLLSAVSEASQHELANATPDGDPDAAQQQHAWPEVRLMRTERVPGQAARHQHAGNPAREGEGPGTPLLQPLPHDVIMQRLPGSSGLGARATERSRGPEGIPLGSHLLGWVMVVGMPGFEPGASCSQSRRANQAAPHPVKPAESYPVRWEPAPPCKRAQPRISGCA
jgi:hypothetical protein